MEQSTPTSTIPSLGDIADPWKDSFLQSLYSLFQISLIKLCVVQKREQYFSLKKPISAHNDTPQLYSLQ